MKFGKISKLVLTEKLMKITSTGEQSLPRILYNQDTVAYMHIWSGLL